MRFIPADTDLRGLALFLDVDGTLLELEEHPEDVRSDEELIAMLHDVSAQLDGALSLISGRRIADIDRIFAPATFPAAGSHGAEIRLHDGDRVATVGSAWPRQLSAELDAFAKTHDGLLLEHKLGGVSLHYRSAPELEDLCRERMVALMQGLGDDYRLIAGKMVFELAPRGADKGKAIRKMMQHEPFAGRRPVFVGDDATDEDGFRVVNSMQGITVRVGAIRGSAAKHSFGSVSEVRGWLGSLQQEIIRPRRDTETGP